MTDNLDDLHAELKAATPEPDASRRARNLALAQKNFEQIQGSREQARPTSESRPITGRLKRGVWNMIETLTSRGGLAATTALVAVGFFFVIPESRSLLSPTAEIPKGVEGSTGISPVKTDVALIPNEQRQMSELAIADALTRERAEVDAKDDRDLAAVKAPMMEDTIVLEELEATTSAVSQYSAAPQKLSKKAEAVGRSVSQDGLTTSGERSRMLEPSVVLETGSDTEAFANEAPNPLKIVATDPVSTFSIDVDTAAYAIVRSSLNNGALPSKDAVRVEEMVNYFPYSYAAPDTAEGPFKSTVSVFETPWNADTQLVHIALQGQTPALEDRPPLNLVFLIDTSGSMQDANKLPLLKQSFRLMLGQLRPDDQVAIVTYAGSAGQVLEPTAAAERSTILAALDNLHAGGSTAGQAGLQQAFAVAEKMTEDGELTRVLLATDGDFNVGLSDPDLLKEFIADKRDSGTYLSVLGFGRGNLDDATMQALAQNGNGQAAYIDTLNEAQKVLVDQLTGALFPIANDVKIQVEFNPAEVAEYRLVGYETRALNREDFNNDKVDAGEIGAGHSVTAIYEITPVGSPAVMHDPLRYQPATTVIESTDELPF